MNATPTHPEEPAVRRSFTGLPLLLMPAVVIQFFLAASGAVDSARGEESFRAHRALGELVFGLHAVNGLAILAVVMTIVREAGRVSRPAARQAP